MADNLEKDIIDTIKRKEWTKGAIVGAIAANVGALVGQIVLALV